MFQHKLHFQRLKPAIRQTSMPRHYIPKLSATSDRISVSMLASISFSPIQVDIVKDLSTLRFMTVGNRLCKSQISLYSTYR